MPASAMSFLESFDNPRALVVGDIMLDRYTWGNAERISPEAPVPVLRVDQQEVRLGGAASVASLLTALGAKVELAGVVGSDGEGRIVQRVLKDQHIAASGVLVDVRRRTTVKDRFVGRAGGKHPHQLLRVDTEDRRELDLEQAMKLLEFIAEAISRCDSIVISDYAKGVCAEMICRETIRMAREQDRPIIVDPARISDFSKYDRCNILKPNRDELSLATDSDCHTPTNALTAAKQLRERHCVDAVVATLDVDGIACVARDGTYGHFPTRVREIYDITGAGDTIAAVLGRCAAANFSWPEIAELANVAAGLQVEQFGVAPISADSIFSNNWSEIPTNDAKIVTVEQLLPRIDEIRVSGKRIVFTNGCFDLLHMGHVKYLEQAAALADILIVGINSDRSVKQLKGSNRPIILESDRASMLAALGSVDFVIVFDELTPIDLLRLTRPDVLVKGGTYSRGEIVGREIVESYGGRVCAVGNFAGRSTTSIIRDVVGKDSDEMLSRTAKN